MYPGIFFISSNGSMATQWLSTVLSASSRIQCFHGVLGLLPEDNTELPQVIAALQSQVAQKGTFAGVVHLKNAHGSEAVKAILNARGNFVALLRNPVEVVNSQFIAKAAMPDREKEAQRWLVKQKQTPFPFEWLHPDNAVFGRVVVMALKHYVESALLPPDRVFRFENYTRDYGEIQRMLRTITSGQITDCADITKAHREAGLLNQHHRRPVTWEDIFFREWDDDQRSCFKRVYRDIEAKVPEQFLPALRCYSFLPELCAV